MNKRLIAFLPILSLLLSLPLTPVNAAAKAGGTCSKAGIKSVVSGKTYTCIKSGKKLVWNKGVAVAASNPTPAATPTTAASYATLWEKYSWVKPTSASSVASAATDKFSAYVAVTRSKDTVIKIIAQEGADQTLLGWVKDGANLVAKAFDYPKLSKPFLIVIGIDRAWVEKTYIENGWNKNEAKDLAEHFGLGSPAGAIDNRSNLYDSGVITRNNSLVNDKLGMMQTPGHEFFHAVQFSWTGPIADASGSKVPNWFWEGPPTFIGLQTASYLGLASYTTEGRQMAVGRSNHPSTKSHLLSEATANTGAPDAIDPYGIGAIATEFLVANVGMEKFMDIHTNLGKKKSFADSFKTATGVELTDFYTMFEEARPVLGIPRS
ncbi:unannotated protein [freshwater metagenome]|uniref:Unannotated protein n=1 Tax=freshwater metagenome TaxID=449393 RepID=A0A6J7TDA0_9ZZZZ|nr:hypothetical protein [Actinomycetota bacterium]